MQLHEHLPIHAHRPALTVPTRGFAPSTSAKPLGDSQSALTGPGPDSTDWYPARPSSPHLPDRWPSLRSVQSSNELTALNSLPGIVTPGLGHARQRLTSPGSRKAKTVLLRRSPRVSGQPSGAMHWVDNATVQRLATLRAASAGSMPTSRFVTRGRSGYANVPTCGAPAKAHARSTTPSPAAARQHPGSARDLDSS